MNPAIERIREATRGTDYEGRLFRYRNPSSAQLGFALEATGQAHEGAEVLVESGG